MKIEDNRVVLDENDMQAILPYNDNMSRTECYNKGMLDFAEAVKRKIDTAREAKEQHSYMYWGGIFDNLLDNLESLTHSVIAFKKK